MRDKLYHSLKLCLVTNINNQPMNKYIKFIEHAAMGGITMVQLREKSGNPLEVKERARELQRLLRSFEIPLIINDYVELAAEIDADGVHIGQQDMSAFRAREILGPDKIIGLSVESLEEVEKSNNLTNIIDYITASAVFPSKTKPDCKKIWGIDGLRQVVENSKHPVTAIGGIKLHNTFDIINTGAKGIAVIGAIHDSPNPYQAVQNLRRIIDSKEEIEFQYRR